MAILTHALHSRAARLVAVSGVSLSLLVLAGCANQSASSSVYTYGQAQQEQIVRYGTVVSVRSVTIQNDKSSGVGGISGAALGGVAGSTIGGGKGQILAAIGGALLGGLAGRDRDGDGFLVGHSVTPCRISAARMASVGGLYRSLFPILPGIVGCGTGLPSASSLEKLDSEMASKIG